MDTRLKIAGMTKKRVFTLKLQQPPSFDLAQDGEGKSLESIYTTNFHFPLLFFIALLNFMHPVHREAWRKKQRPLLDQIPVLFHLVHGHIFHYPVQNR